jgi:hypothetical protein
MNTTTIADSDSTFVLPLGAGVQLNLSQHLVLDARFTYRMTFDNDLTQRQDRADIYTAMLRLGFVI